MTCNLKSEEKKNQSTFGKVLHRIYFIVLLYVSNDIFLEVLRVSLSETINYLKKEDVL